jgi:hypothetical protein
MAAVLVGQIGHVRVLQTIFLLLRERRAVVPGDEQRDGGSAGMFDGHGLDRSSKVTGAPYTWLGAVAGLAYVVAIAVQRIKG